MRRIPGKLRGTLWVRGWQEITGATLVLVAADKDQEAPAGGNNVAWLKTGVVHGPLIRYLGVLLFGGGRVGSPVAGVRDERLGALTGVLHALLPLLKRECGVGKVLRLLCEAACR